MPETITIDREAVMALLIEAEGVSNALAKIAGCYPTPLSEELDNRTATVAEAVLGAWPNDDDDESHPRINLYEAGHERARALLAELAGLEREEVASAR